DMFPPEDQPQVRSSLAAALRFVLAQRLLPGADGESLVAAAELVTGVLPLATLIRDDKLYQLGSLLQRGRAFGMIRLDESLAVFATNHDLDFAHAYADKARFRGNYMGKTTGIGGVFRTIPTKILGIDELGVPAGVRRLAELSAGLVLVTGPTGSGKSTTLAAV